jgi:SAM-dependent methyltransferase
MSTYSLGSQDPEITRLELQSDFLEAPTRLLLAGAGITSGMRVLDLGSGLGHVSRAVADLVGPEGEVVGVDADERMVREAQERTSAENVHYMHGEVGAWSDDRPFDALVGRLILFHLADPVGAVRHHLAGLRPGGRVVVLDYDIGSLRSDPPEPVTTRLGEILLEAFRAVGADPTIGARLWGILDDAGVCEVAGFGVQPYLAPRSPVGPMLLAGVLSTLAPAVVAHGIATAEELDVEHLSGRIADALSRSGSVLLPPTLAGVWGTRA